jgi:hypothetical protein
MFILLAQANNLDIQSQMATISPVGTVGKLVEMGAGGVLVVGTLAVLGYLLLGGFHWITAGGEKGKIEEARTMITQAIVGIAVLASVFAAFSLLLGFFGIRDRIDLGFGGGAGGGGNGGGGTQICTPGQTGSDGSAGGYCNLNGQPAPAQMNCMTTANITYPHWEPCSCISGVKSWNWTACGSNGNGN